MEKIRLEHISKSYAKGDPVIGDFSLSIEDGEFVVLLGPSGCGKSTLLRIIAGLEDINQGKIYIDGQDVTDKPPKDRDIAMVFQNYALYPHMTVYKNISISLELKKMPPASIDEKVHHAAQVLAIEDLLPRKPRQLSGGQMQRVALARAIVRQPKVFLMDEPLSNLDAKLRVHTRAEIIKLYQRLGTTTVFVTHDQVEALTMATKIVLLKDGAIQQTGTPEELYDHPVNMFTAAFIGTPQMNFLPAALDQGQLTLLGRTCPLDRPAQPVMAGLRPEALSLAEGTTYTVDFVENLGSEKYAYLDAPATRDGKICVKCPARSTIRSGDQYDLHFNLEDCHLFNADSGQRL